MSGLTKSEWVKRCAGIEELWPGKGWPPETVASSFAHFRNLSADVVDAALLEVFGEAREFPPAPSVLLAKAREIELASRAALPAPDMTRPLTEAERARAVALAAALTGESAKRVRDSWKTFAAHAGACVACERVANLCRQPGLTTETANRAGDDVCDDGRPLYGAWREAVRSMVARYPVPA